jgi:magnesium transporter
MVLSDAIGCQIEPVTELPAGKMGRMRPQEAPEQSMDPRPDHISSPAAALERSVVDAAVYRDGRRIPGLTSVSDVYSRPSGSMAWIGLLRPADEQLHSAAEQFNLHPLAVEDAIVAHQRPKRDRYGDTQLVVLRSARYLDETETVDFGEIHIFTGPQFVLTVRHSDAPDLADVRQRLEADPELLALGPDAVLYAVLDAVVDGYAPVVAGLQNDIDEIETQVFDRDPGVSRRIYELSREVIEFQRAVKPLLAVLKGLTAGMHEELLRNLRDVADHATIVGERADSFRQLLDGILTVNTTLVGQAQIAEMNRLAEAAGEENIEVKKISAWAAILFAPTLVGTIYGMNFDNMPELHWTLGYPFALGLMGMVCLVLYIVFKKRGWL